MTKAVPAVIGGKYRVVGRLGQGAMGSVYEAQAEDGRRVAVKVIMTELANNPTLVGRFEREARAASAIDTPHIAKTLDTGTDPATGLPYLVMELLDGQDLEQALKGLGPFHADLALRVAAQACLALREAHGARVLHRDIKPANLFLAKQAGERVVKLLDFGVAKVRPEVGRSGAETAGLTRTGSMLGSPLYMSPEQARGYKDIDFRSDIWSLGVVLYKMLCGRAPHDDTDELGELIILICTEPPPPIQDFAPWIAPEIAAVVHRALRFSPAERWGSAAEMYGAIRALLPGTEAIAEGLLRPMSEAEKALVAPRLAMDLTDAPVRRKTQSTGSGMTMPANIPPPAASQPAMPPSGQSAAGPASWSMGAPPTHSMHSGTVDLVNVAPPGRSPLPLVLLGAALALGAGGFAAYRFTGGAAPPATAPPQATAAPDEKPRTVTVVVLPEGAAVEVDGAAATLSEGVLEVTGSIGSVHKVKVTAGGAEKTVRVVVAESGAIPPKIEVEGAAPARPSTAAPAATPTAPGPLTGPKPKPTSTGKPPEDLRNKR